MNFRNFDGVMKIFQFVAVLGYLITEMLIELQMFVCNLLISVKDNYSNKFNNNVLMLKTSYEERRVFRDNKSFEQEAGSYKLLIQN